MPFSSALVAILARLSPTMYQSPKAKNDYIPLQANEFDTEDGRGLSFRRRRRVLTGLYVAVALLVGLLFGVGASSKGSTQLIASYMGKDTPPSVLGVEAFEDVTDLSNYLATPNATNSFRDNLKPNVKYVTTGNSAGMTNVFEGYLNMVYLAMISQRVAVVPPLAPSQTHLGHVPLPFLPFGEVFDLPRLAKAIRTPIVEWSDIKIAPYNVPWTDKSPKVEGVQRDTLGCWSTRQVKPNGFPGRTSLAPFLDLDIAYTPIPQNTVIDKTNDQVSFWGLAYLLDPEGRQRAFNQEKVKTGISMYSKTAIAPDEQFACFDDTYFVGAVASFEWERDISPGWRFVGIHTHFTPKVDDMVEELLRRVLDVPISRNIGPFIAVHIRRGDFEDSCKNKNPDYQCFAPLQVYAARIRQVQEELQERFGAVTTLGNVRDVIVTSDERNQTFWKEVKRMGWLSINHETERTAEVHGRWWPAIIDAAVQSQAIGFVGTKRSTMSRVAMLRVRDWNGGVTRLVSWSNGKGA